MKSKLLAALVIFMLSKSAMAGGSSAGNGGNTIVCFDGNNQIKSVELLDFYEARIKRGITPDLGADTLSVDDKVALAISRIKGISMQMSEQMAGTTSNFKYQSVFLPGIRLVAVDDSDHLFVPAGCQQEQTAIQKTPEFPGDKLYNIDQDLWNHMDSNNRAGLILHEAFYHLALTQGKPEDSVPVRFLVSSISSAGSITEKDFVQVLRAVKITEVGLHGYQFAITDVEPAFYYNGEFCGGTLAYENKTWFQKVPIRINALIFDLKGSILRMKLSDPAYLKIGNQSLWFAPNEYILVYPDQTIGNGTVLPQNAEFKMDGKYDLRLTDALSKPTLIVVDGTGRLERCDDCQGQVTVDGQVLDVNQYQYVANLISVNVAHLSHFEYKGLDLPVQGKFFMDDRSFLEANLGAPLQLNVGQAQVVFGIGEMEVDVKGHVLYGVLDEDTTLIYSVNHAPTPYLKGMRVYFDSLGEVTQAIYPNPNPITNNGATQ
jgi:hypothetical protein